MRVDLHISRMVTEVDQSQRGEPWGSDGDERTVRLMAIHETGHHDPADRG